MAEESRRKTIQRSDIVAAIARSSLFDFLVHLLTPEEIAVFAKTHSVDESFFDETR